MTALLVFVRGLHEASLMVLFGSACLLALLGAKVPELALESRALALGRRLAALTALLSAPAWLALAVAAMADTDATPSDTLFVHLFLLRLLLLLALLVTVWRGQMRLTVLLSGLALILIAVSSHTAGASPFGFWFIGATSDGLHLLTGGYWIGSLCVLAVLLAQSPVAPRLGLAISIFAEWGMVAVALLVMTGMINATMVLLGNPGHDAWPYLLVLGVKLALVTAMIALAMINQVRLLPRFAQTGTVVRLRKHVGWELGLGVAVIGLAMTLALLPPTVQ
jgi:putative copper resistance protein D